MSSIVAFDKREVAERIKYDLMSMIDSEGGRLPSFYIDLHTLDRSVEYNQRLHNDAVLSLCQINLTSLTEQAHECNLTVDVVCGEPGESGYAQTESFTPVYDTRRFAEYLERMYEE